MATNRSLRIVVITSPERVDEEWISRLATEPDVGRVERVGVLAHGIDLVQQTRPDLVIVDRDLEQAEACVRQIFTSLPTTLCISLVAQADVSVVRRMMTAGARDVLTRPLRYAELMKSIRSTIAMEMDRRSRAVVSLGDEGRPFGRGKLVVVISPKGGAGTTTIATNLAVALRQMSSGRVALADFGLQFGHAGVLLNIFSRHTLEDLIDKPEEVDDAMLSTVMQQHSSGVHILLAPESPDIAARITEDQLAIVIDRLTERYSYVVADTWCVLDEATLSLLGRADEVLVVTTPEVPSLKNVKFLLEYIRRHNFTTGRISIVLNRFPSVDGISLEDVQQHLRHPVSANIPSAGQLVTYSVNRGIPVVVSHPQSWVAQSFRRLAANIAGEQTNPLTTRPEDKKGWNKQNQTTSTRRSLLSFIRREA